MPAPLNRRLIGLAAAVFVAALALGYVVSSSGQAEEPARPVGTRAVPLEMPAAGAEPTGLADTAPLPAMARRPSPPPPPPEPVIEPDPELEPEPELVPEEPVPPDPVYVPPPAPAPAPEPAPPPEPPPVEFDDEG